MLVTGNGDWKLIAFIFCEGVRVSRLSGLTNLYKAGSIKDPTYTPLTSLVTLPMAAWNLRKLSVSSTSDCHGGGVVDIFNFGVIVPVSPNILKLLDDVLGIDTPP